MPFSAVKSIQEQKMTDAFTGKMTEMSQQKRQTRPMIGPAWRVATSPQPTTNSPSYEASKRFT